MTSSALRRKHGNWFSGALTSVCLALIISQSTAAVLSLSKAPLLEKYWTNRGAAFFGPTEAFSDPGVVKAAHCHYEELCLSARATIDRFDLMPSARAKYTPGIDSPRGQDAQANPARE